MYILLSFAKNKVPIGAWVYFWAFYLVALVYISVFVPVPYCLDDCQFSSVTQSCPTLSNPMNRSTPGLPVHHQLPEFTQTHTHGVSDAIQPSHPLSSPSPPAPNPSLPASFIEEAVFAPLYILVSFVKNKVPIGAWVYFWAFYLVPLVYISVFMLVPYCLDDCSFVV